jgi:hypothetical protein
MSNAALSVVLTLLAAPLADAGLTAYSTAVLGDNPAMYWTFDETGTANAIEQVNTLTADDLVATAGATRASHASLGSGLLLGSAADFRGTSGHFLAANLSPTTALPGAYAIEFWMKVEHPASADEQAYCINFRAPGDNHPAVIFDWKTPANEVELFESTSGVGRTSGGPVVNDSDWHYFLFVVYGGSGFGVANRVDAFLDDGLPATVTGTFSQQLDLSQFLAIGTTGHTSPHPLNGLIDELALYDLEGLNEAEIEATAGLLAQHFQAAVPEPSSWVLSLSAVGLLLPVLRRRRNP